MIAFLLSQTAHGDRRRRWLRIVLHYGHPLQRREIRCRQRTLRSGCRFPPKHHPARPQEQRHRACTSPRQDFAPPKVERFHRPYGGAPQITGAVEPVAPLDRQIDGEHRATARRIARRNDAIEGGRSCARSTGRARNRRPDWKTLARTDRRCARGLRRKYRCHDRAQRAAPPRSVGRPAAPPDSLRHLDRVRQQVRDDLFEARPIPVP